MKSALLFLLVFGIAKISNAQFKPADEGSTLKFTIKNLGFGTDGSFSGFDGIINFAPQNLPGSNFDVSINAASVNTGNTLRDEHLRGDGFFDVKNFPRIRLKSTKLTGGNGGSYQFNGLLTVKGKTNPVSFPFTAALTADGYTFKGGFKIKRKDFGVGGTSTVSDELEVMISVTAKKANP